MRSEASKSFKHGFTLTEQELRRIYDQVCQQIKSTKQDGDITSDFTLKFKNGVISNPTSLDEILSQENLGSSAIQRLSITVHGNNVENSKIFVQFNNVDTEDSDAEDRPIRYKVEGNDRDWVFVTSSQLEERIGRTKTFAIPKTFFNSVPTFWGPTGLLAIFYFIIVVDRQDQLDQLNRLENQWRSGQIKDIGEITFTIARQALGRQYGTFTATSFWIPILLFLATIIGLMVFGKPIASYLFPPFNFLWGDYVKVYDSRKSFRNFVLGVIVLGILLSVVGNYIYGYLINR